MPKEDGISPTCVSQEEHGEVRSAGICDLLQAGWTMLPSSRGHQISLQDEIKRSICTLAGSHNYSTNLMITSDSLNASTSAVIKPEENFSNQLKRKINFLVTETGNGT